MEFYKAHIARQSKHLYLNQPLGIFKSQCCEIPSLGLDPALAIES